MALELLDLRRAQSVLDLTEVDLRFADCGFAERDDVDFMVILRMDDCDRNAGQQTKRDKTLFAIGEAIILEGECHAIEHQRRVHEIEAVRLEIRFALRFRPGELDAHNVYTPCIDVKLAGRTTNSSAADRHQMVMPRSNISGILYQ